MKIPKVNNEFYNLYRDGVTQSFINKYLTCKEQTRLEYIEGWTPKQEKIWFTYGKLMHDVISNSYAYGEVPNQEFINNCVKNYEAKHLTQIPTADMQTKEIILGLAEHLTPVYFSKFRNDFNQKHIINESRFKIKFDPTYYTDRTREELVTHFNKIIPITGRTDGGLLSGNDLWVMDLKCLSMIDDDLASILPFDTQVMLYLWAMRRSYPQYNIKGFIYRIIRKPAHKFGKNDNSVKSFCERVIVDIYSRLDEFFIEYKIPISGEEIDQWEENFLIPVLCEIEQWAKSNYKSYVNPNALITKYGHCSTFDIITKQDYTGHYRRAKPFMELE